MSGRELFRELCRLGLEPVLAAARERYVRRGELRGRVKVELGRAAREELANLIGRTVRPQPGSQIVSVDLTALDEALQRSRFHLALMAVLEGGYGTLRSRLQEQAEASAAWEAWCRSLQEGLAQHPEGARWLAAALESDAPSDRWIRRAYREDPVAAGRAVDAVGRALSALPVWQGGHELLALFAAAITGDPHAFDATAPAGILLSHALRERFGTPPPGLRPSEERALLLDLAGLGVDQVSSTVLVAHLEGAEVYGAPHPVVAAMATYGGAWALTLGEVRGWSAVRARHRRAWIVENPPVFEALLKGVADWPAGERPTLICTGGFLSAAAVRLLDLLVDGGATLRYGGDFDRNGVAIAAWLADRYPGVCRPWGMEPEDYRGAVEGSEKRLEADDVRWLQELSGPLGPTARAMAADGRVAYQERVVGRLLASLGTWA